MSGMVPPPPQQTQTPARANVLKALQKPNPQPRPNPQPPAAAVRDMKGPVNIEDLLKSVNTGVESKSVKMPPSAMKKGGSTGKNSVTIKL
jgi:hypothetical protein